MVSIARPPWSAYLCLAASMALVGSYVGLSRQLVAVLPVFLLAWLRFGIAAVAMAHWVRRTPAEAPLTPKLRRLLFWESFLGNFLFSICMLYGVALTSALSAGVVMAAIPAAVALLARWWLGERIGRRVMLAIACAAAGMASATATSFACASPVTAFACTLPMRPAPRSPNLIAICLTPSPLSACSSPAGHHAP